MLPLIHWGMDSDVKMDACDGPDQMMRCAELTASYLWTLDAAVPANSKNSLLLDGQRQHASNSHNVVLAPMIPCRRP